MEENKKILIGKFCKLFGILGYISIISYTEPLENIFYYSCFVIINKKYYILEYNNWKKFFNKTIVKIHNFSFNHVKKLVNKNIYTLRENFRKNNKGDFYYSDLENFLVRNINNTFLGYVNYFIENKSQKIMLLKPKHILIPFIRYNIVKNIDLKKKYIIVDWEN